MTKAKAEVEAVTIETLTEKVAKLKILAEILADALNKYKDRVRVLADKK